MAEGAALEMPCRGNSTVGSNPTPSAKLCFVGSPRSCRLARRVQMRGGAGRQHARRTLCTLSVLPTAPTKQLGPYRRPAPLAVLDGEVAVPCNPQSAIAGLNSLSRGVRVERALRDGVEGWALRNEPRRIPPGPEGSNGKAFRSCAVGVPDRSRLRLEIAGRAFRLRVHGHSLIRGGAGAARTEGWLGSPSAAPHSASPGPPTAKARCTA